MQRLLPDGIEFTLLYDFENNEVREDHIRGIELTASESSDCLVTGTCDAAGDPNYRHLYEKYGWRTVIYWLIDIVHPVIPEGADRDKLILRLPAIFMSRQSNALDEAGFEESVMLVNLTMSAMLLRIGLTLFGTRSDRLWESIPGALLLVSPEYVYQVNDIARNWFGPLPDKKRSLEIDSYIPADVAAWVRETIGTDGVYSEDEGNRRFWIDLASHRKLRIHAGLRAFRPWDHIRTTSRMATGFEGIGMEEVNRRIHLLLMRDVTREWEAEVLQREIDLARRMQQELLPSGLPVSSVYDIAATCRPARHIGGDLYDVVQLGTGHVAMIIGDATGHGVDSALLAALVSGAFRASIQQYTAPEDILQTIDRVLRTTRQHGFVTLIYLLMDPSGSRMEYGLAGHYPPILWSEDIQKCILQPAASLPLGVNLPAHYDTGSFSIKPGDVIAAFSDGLLELREKSGQSFQETLTTLLKTLRKKPARHILKEVFRRAARVTPEESQQDDMTGIIVRICGSK